ncbi:glycoprotein 3-alpha-L-fucosyltransferase A-like [Strongylocentrotus purpuratus]|uniref:Fucosyltransferase n=1 Tax=Strongylocentrotus purpuratus TaxID=7668 RepID=A0A7M7PHT4_STRPU|nr:glycoprotein 3-alpha-L-fucosyltransferase A-like [Strongylocentrotus purpuratus]
MAMRKSRFCMLLLTGALGYIQLIYLMMSVDFQPCNVKHSNLERVHGAESTSCPRKVHLWARDAGELGYSQGIHEIKCPGSTCDVQLSVDMTLETMQKNEALILFHWSKWDWETLHCHRPWGQKWVFYTLESPLNTKEHVVPPTRYYSNTYDYIMSFRYDSDFRADYGQYLAGKPELEANVTRNWAKNRSRLVVWMASNCKKTTWPRQDFVNRLARYINVDMYGRCGNQTCTAGTEHCERALKQHKFLLALENSECTDYITEKFWIQALYREIVPIVFGPPRSDYEKVAPPNSFIHIQDFETARELGEFLKKVDADDALYGKYFEWKKKGSLKPYGGSTRSIMCELGDRLEADAKAVRNGTYKPTKQKDWKTWWLDSCKKKGRVPK